MAETHEPFPSRGTHFRSVVLMGLITASAGIAAAQEGGIAVRREAFGEAFTAVNKAPPTQSRVYVYRMGDTGSAKPVNIYLNGRYHASLMRGAYSEFCLAPGKVTFRAAPDDAYQLEIGKHTMLGSTLNTQAGQAIFLRLQDSGTMTVSAQPLTEQQALPELRRTRRQIHTISRAPAVQECNNAVESPALAQAPEPQREYALETDALFEFGDSELRAMGFNAIETLIQQVRKDYSQFDRIRVIGYTDTIGSIEYNKRLSQQRADTVARHLATRGLQPKQGIQSEGRWSLDLPKPHCNSNDTPANRVCHAPNRRVVIVVYGLRR